ncbi:hypothetical protein ACR782_21150 [Sphingobacterium spiritivorum]|uniref:hypothetical protein n=1 Tax=Sphingobacterium spiritivorum TaxID=258 RepID=UPI003DA213C4
MKAIHNCGAGGTTTGFVVVNIIKSKNRPHGSSAIPLKNKLLMANESNSQPISIAVSSIIVVVNIIKSKNESNSQPILIYLTDLLSCCKYH